MAGSNARKTKANAEPTEPASPAKRARRASPSDRSSTASSSHHPTATSIQPVSPVPDDVTSPTTSPGVMPSVTPTVQPTLAEGAPLPVAEGVHPGSAQAGNTSQTEADNTVQLVNSVDADEPVEADDEVLDIPEYVPDDIIPRLNNLRSYVEPSRGRYSILNIPPTAAWGTRKGSDRYLSYQGSQLLVWVLGVVRHCRLIDNKSYSIGVQPFSASEIDAAHDNNAGRCKPQRPLPEDGSLTFANKWINSNNRTIKHKFTNVYDATDLQMQGWDDRRKVPPERIQLTDVVLFECYIRRYRTDGSNGPDWSVWAVNFELLRIAQLVIGPGPADEDPSKSSGAI